MSPGSNTASSGHNAACYRAALRCAAALRPHPVVVLVLALLAGGCGAKPQDDYVALYEAALLEFPGVPGVDSARMDAFTAVFDNLQSETWEEAVRSLYAPVHHFSDTLTHTRELDDLVRHFQRMRDAGGADVTITGRLMDGPDVYLVWRMTFEFQPLVRTVTSHTIGMTHLRFDESGRIVVHQDFWDSAAGFYQHLPVIGSALRTVRRQFDVEN